MLEFTVRMEREQRSHLLEFTLELGDLVGYVMKNGNNEVAVGHQGRQLRRHS